MENTASGFLPVIRRNKIFFEVKKIGIGALIKLFTIYAGSGCALKNADPQLLVEPVRYLPGYLYFPSVHTVGNKGVTYSTEGWFLTKKCVLVEAKSHTFLGNIF